MNCNCITDTEKKLAEFLQPQAGADAKAVCQGAAIQLTKTMGLWAVINILFRVKGSKKGFTGEKGKEMIVAAAYCPFCGRDARQDRYRVGEDEGIAAAVAAGKGETYA